MVEKIKKTMHFIKETIENRQQHSAISKMYHLYISKQIFSFVLYAFIPEGLYMPSNLAALSAESSIWSMEPTSTPSRLWRISALLSLVSGSMVIVVLALEGGAIGVEVTVMNCGRLSYKKHVINRGKPRQRLLSLKPLIIGVTTYCSIGRIRHDSHRDYRDCGGHSG